MLLNAPSLAVPSSPLPAPSGHAMREEPNADTEFSRELQRATRADPTPERVPQTAGKPTPESARAPAAKSAPQDAATDRPAPEQPAVGNDAHAGQARLPRGWRHPTLGTEAGRTARAGAARATSAGDPRGESGAATDTSPTPERGPRPATQEPPAMPAPSAAAAPPPTAAVQAVAAADPGLASGGQPSTDGTVTVTDLPSPAAGQALHDIAGASVALATKSDPAANTPFAVAAVAAAPPPTAAVQAVAAADPGLASGGQPSTVTAVAAEPPTAAQRETPAADSAELGFDGDRENATALSNGLAREGAGSAFNSFGAAGLSGYEARTERAASVEGTPRDAAAPTLGLRTEAIAEAIDSPAFVPALGARLAVMARDGIEQARLNVNPAELGPIAVRMALEGTHLRVEMTAEAAATRHALEQSLPDLASSLRDAGFTLAGGGVFQQAPQDGRQPGRDETSASLSDAGAASAQAAPPAEQVLRRIDGLVDLFA